jgi:hypothetical protein
MITRHIRIISALTCTVACTLACTLISAPASAQSTSTASVDRSVDIPAAKEKGAAERIVGEAVNGSFEIVVDATADAPRIEAQFTIDGTDEKDVKRRTELIKLFAERAADQTIVVQPIFPGKSMPRDNVKVRIMVPKCGDTSVRSANGTLSATGTAGKLKLIAKNGAIRIENHTGSVDAYSMNGAIDIIGATAEVRASATNGQVTVTMADNNDLPFDLETRNGAVHMEVGVGFDGIVKMHTTSGGLDLSDSGKRARTPQSSDHGKTVEIGAAGGTSEIRTTTGSINLTIRSK